MGTITTNGTGDISKVLLSTGSTGWKWYDGEQAEYKNMSEIMTKKVEEAEAKLKAKEEQFNKLVREYEDLSNVANKLDRAMTTLVNGGPIRMTHANGRYIELDVNGNVTIGTNPAKKQASIFDAIDRVNRNGPHAPMMSIIENGNS
jgi:hypothetical protein